MLPEVGANQHWPYGLVDAEGSEFYARQLDGNFFADVKNSSFFLQALEEDAREKQVDADAHLKTVRLNAKKFMQGNTIVDRKAFIQSLTDAIFEDGLLTLVLGGKSVGKSLVVSYVADKVRQAQGSSRTVVLANLRRGGEADFYQAVFGAAAEQQGLAEKLPSLFKEVVTMASGLVAAAENLNAATAPLAASVRSIIGIMQPEQKALTFSKLVKSIQETGNNTAIIIDEANLALPNDGNDAKAETAKTALAQITGETKEAFTASVILISSEHGYPCKLANAGLNLDDRQRHHRSRSAAKRHAQDAHRPLGHGAETRAPLRGHLRRLHSGGLQGSGQPDQQSQAVLSAAHYIRAWHRQLHGKGTLGAGCGLCFFGWLGRFAPKFLPTSEG